MVCPAAAAAGSNTAVLLLSLVSLTCLLESSAALNTSHTSLYPLTIRNFSIYLEEFLPISLELTKPIQTTDDLLSLLSFAKQKCYQGKAAMSLQNGGLKHSLQPWSQHCLPLLVDGIAKRMHEVVVNERARLYKQSNPTEDFGVQRIRNLADTVRSQRCVPSIYSSHQWRNIPTTNVADDGATTVNSSSVLNTTYIHLGGGYNRVLNHFLNIDIGSFTSFFQTVYSTSKYQEHNAEEMGDEAFRTSANTAWRILSSQENGDILTFPDMDSEAADCRYMRYNMSNRINPLPSFIQNNSVHYLFSEHFVEHIERDQLINILENVRRVLAKNGKGVARISTPDLRTFIKAYMNPTKEDGWHDMHKKQLSSVVMGFSDVGVRETHIGYWGTTKHATMTNVLNDLFHLWGHDKGFLYDFEEFHRVASAAGFSSQEIKRVEFQKPSDSPMSHLDQYWRRLDSFYVELRNFDE
jgi:predicted SAM-dependent methyltransferase